MIIGNLYLRGAPAHIQFTFASVASAVKGHTTTEDGLVKIQDDYGSIGEFSAKDITGWLLMDLQQYTQASLNKEVLIANSYEDLQKARATKVQLTGVEASGHSMNN